ncbi:MAG TPA: response regulator [Candidatus Binatia bacterium]|nr:response regulator [Candidatus Binatia bacterium]
MPKFLVIDDDDSFRQAAVCALQKKGFETCEAGDGAAGAELARRLLPDLIICDINMSKMDGYTLLETLRHEPATAAIPVILMTGMGDAASMRRGMNLGADDYLAKPFSAPQMFSAVDARLKQHQALRQNAEKKLADLRANLSLALPHEMITPLNGIFASAQILSTSPESLTLPEIAEYGATILQSAERLHRTVQNFLLYGQLEMQASDPKTLAGLREKRTEQARQVIEARARRQAEKATRIADLQLDLAEGSIAVGQDLFTKLVDELVDNAFKFSTAGTTVRVASSSSKDHYTLSVSDRGRGMDGDQIANIGAYAQFDRTTHEQQGSGLGLILARRITQLSGGEFSLQSQRDAGTTVTVKLPLAAN